jgi:predicted enzyme related to lactoylglutathione lyase
MATGPRRVGDFCWINLLTPKPEQARAFFGALLGWTYNEIPGMGHIVKVGGRDIGSLFDREGPNTPKGPPLIGVMVKVASADATCERVRSLGGKAQPAFDVMANLRMAVCTDPNGAEFDVWEPKKQLGTDADSRAHGAPSWFETMTTDVDRAAKFYFGVFGWTPEIMPMPGTTYTTFKHGTEYIAGMLQITAQMGEMRPHWSTYFTVKDADETAREAVKLGAFLCVPVQGVAGVGRLCGITSPQGVTFFVMQYAP